MDLVMLQWRGKLKRHDVISSGSQVMIRTLDECTWNIQEKATQPKKLQLSDQLSKRAIRTGWSYDRPVRTQLLLGCEGLICTFEINAEFNNPL